VRHLEVRGQAERERKVSEGEGTANRVEPATAYAMRELSISCSSELPSRDAHIRQVWKPSQMCSRYDDDFL
jgi:hypothetical protein